MAAGAPQNCDPSSLATDLKILMGHENADETYET